MPLYLPSSISGRTSTLTLNEIGCFAKLFEAFGNFEIQLRLAKRLELVLSDRMLNRVRESTRAALRCGFDP